MLARMATAPDPGKLVASLHDVAEHARQAWGDDPRAADRLAQLDGAIATATMAVEALDEEKVRRDHDRAERVRRATADEQ